MTERWGVKVTAVEIREIIPPNDIQKAMTRQMSAERTRRAVVTEADGRKQAAITVAEGDKQAVILRAEGDRQSRILQAEGFSLALQTIFNAARTIDPKTLSLQYLDTLKQLGANPSTKFIFPMEFTSRLRPFLGYVSEAEGNGGGGFVSRVMVPDSTALAEPEAARLSGAGTGRWIRIWYLAARVSRELDSPFGLCAKPVRGQNRAGVRGVSTAPFSISNF